ncbi:hypothetical protein [uncultured Eubacterium sp.]|uniref:hypothetical protein n=1 Tax=uncultured Eubacterium sp. TaxID=165185 RepID=UPI002629CC8C|nr:hypothetical protein [uncultured Eubacterium sp.]
MSNDGVDFSKAKLLADGWQWKMYADGSGHLENADGKSYFGFDLQTGEYKDLNDKWQFMIEYPDHTPYEKFKVEMELDWGGMMFHLKFTMFMI